MSKGELVPFQIPAFAPDSRGNRVRTHLVAYKKADPTRERLYLCGPDEADAQVRLLAVGKYREIDMPTTRAVNFSHVLEFPSGVPDDVIELVTILERVLTMRSSAHLDFALALDWYKKPPGPDSSEFENTPTGELVSVGKYHKFATPRRGRARADLLNAMSDVIIGHPLLSQARTIVAVPGHKADGSSFGEKLAKVVAEKTQKGIVFTDCTSGPRAQAKAVSGQSLYGKFSLPATVSGDVIILDDVYRTGKTMSAVALAARQAGADHVFGLAAVRTLRN